MMKKILLLTTLALTLSFSVSAQVKIQAPHPDLEVKIQSCKYSNGSVYLGLLITNYGSTEDISFLGSQDTPQSIAAKAYDNEGFIYTNKTSTISIGVADGSQNARGEYKGYSIPTNQPTLVNVVITKVCSFATKFERLDLPLKSSGSMKLSEKYPMRIYNLEWVK
ncbi:MAG: hypothetical protein SNI49_07605 [Rikenellaceae bacterium]